MSVGFPNAGAQRLAFLRMLAPTFVSRFAPRSTAVTGMSDPRSSKSLPEARAASQALVAAIGDTRSGTRPAMTWIMSSAVHGDTENAVPASHRRDRRFGIVESQPATGRGEAWSRARHGKRAPPCDADVSALLASPALVAAHGRERRIRGLELYRKNQ